MIWFSSENRRLLIFKTETDPNQSVQVRKLNQKSVQFGFGSFSFGLGFGYLGKPIQPCNRAGLIQKWVVSKKKIIYIKLGLWLHLMPRGRTNVPLPWQGEYLIWYISMQHTESLRGGVENNSSISPTEVYSFLIITWMPSPRRTGFPRRQTHQFI